MAIIAVFVLGADCGDAWRGVVAHLLREGPIANVIVEIADTTVRSPRWAREHDPKRVLDAKKSLRDVADTIWPAALERRHPNRAALYARYLEVYARGRRMRVRNRTWGTYALRLVAFGLTADRPGINQLETAITKMNTWTRRTQAGFVFHTTSPDLDGPRTRGGPCLQYVELLCNADDSVDMVAVYRSHDYTTLALGNFIGLADLLGFICRQTGKTPGKLTVHSVYAFLDGNAKTRRLLGGFARRCNG